MRILNTFKKYQAAKKTTLIVNGKFNKAAIMRAAWEEAKDSPLFRRMLGVKLVNSLLPP
ncbi:hypothetical protein [Klebsiella pneumoniae]